MDEEQFEDRRGRLLGFKVVIVLVFLSLIGKLWLLQGVDADQFRQEAVENQRRTVWELPNRGVIYDRNGVQLVRNVGSFTLAIVRADLPRPPEPVYRRLAK